VARYGESVAVALFTAKDDAGLPLLTRLYQVDTRLGDTKDKLLSSELAEFIWWLTREGRDDTATEADIVSLAKFIACLRPIMDALADGRAPGHSDLMLWRDYEKTYLTNPILEFIYGSEEQGDRPFVRFGPWEAQSENIHEFLIQQAISSLMAAVERAEFKRCAECRCPFPELSQRRIYCSFRCKNRAAIRRAYGRRFAEYKAMRGK
jgi:hypothetical protein